MNIEVVNKYKYTGSGEVVMRGTPLGNPFTLGSEQERNYRIAQYRVWLWVKIKSGDPRVVNELRRLLNIARSGKLILICCCKPKRCHGDIIKSAIEYMNREDI